jgi:hypothetical protein
MPWRLLHSACSHDVCDGHGSPRCLIEGQKSSSVLRECRRHLRAGAAASLRRRTLDIGLPRVHLGPILTAVGLKVRRLGEWFLETSRAKTRITPFARLRAEATTAEPEKTSPAVIRTGGHQHP